MTDRTATPEPPVTAAKRHALETTRLLRELAAEHASTRTPEPPVTEMVERLPSAALFMRGKVPEPLSEADREWLVEQLHAYPRRVKEENTCAIGALTEMATTEFCRLMAEREASTRTPEAAQVEGLFAEQTALVDRLCNAVDLAAEDIGHESIDNLLGLIGPLNDRCIEAL